MATSPVIPKPTVVSVQAPYEAVMIRFIDFLEMIIKDQPADQRVKMWTMTLENISKIHDLMHGNLFKTK